MLLRPILLHVAKYSEYISDRDTEPSGFVSKCALSLSEKWTKEFAVMDGTIKINLQLITYRDLDKLWGQELNINE